MGFTLLQLLPDNCFDAVVVSSGKGAGLARAGSWHVSARSFLIFIGNRMYGVGYEFRVRSLALPSMLMLPWSSRDIHAVAFSRSLCDAAACSGRAAH